MPLYFRNTLDGTITVADDVTPEFHKRRPDGRALYEQTGAHDADPEQYADPSEVDGRSKWGVTNLADVTNDGVAQSDASREQLGDPATLVARRLATDTPPAAQGRRARARARAEKESAAGEQEDAPAG